MKLLYLAAAATMLTGGAALAGNGENAETPAAVEQAAKTTDSKKQKKVCRSEKVTGSLTRVRRICMSQAEWDELAAATHKDLNDRGRNATGGTNSAFNACNAPGAC